MSRRQRFSVGPPQGIGSMIGERRKEFAEQIAVRRMDLHCIKACLLRTLCRVAEGLYNVFAVALVHFMRRFRVFIERDGARRKNDRLIRLTFSACMVELNRDLRAETPRIRKRAGVSACICSSFHRPRQWSEIRPFGMTPVASMMMSPTPPHGAGRCSA